jgi:TldD protein
VSKALNIALEEGAEYAQVSEVKEDLMEIALRGASIESNQSSSKINVVRVLYGGAWGIASSTKFDKLSLASSALKHAKLARSFYSGVELAEAKVAKGSFKFKEIKPVEEENVKKLLVDLAKSIADELKPAFIEAVFTYEKIIRRIFTSDGGEAIETKSLVDLNVSVAVKGFVASSQIGGIGGLESIEIENITSNLVAKIKNMSRARTLNPLMKVKMPVVLNKEAACAFIHEMIHELEADVIAKKGREEVLQGAEELTIYDDPFSGYGSYAFDDEGVVARKKVLVENGEIVNLLHTRHSAKILDDEPKGNGRGLYTIPKAFASNIIVHSGSWEFEEMIEEMREGFIVEGLIRAEIQGNTIAIFPEIAWYVKRGEIVCPVIVNTVKIAKPLKFVRGVGLSAYERIAYEKSFAISEKVPPILIERARVS